MNRIHLRFINFFAAAAFFLCCTSFAQAQATRVFVSGVGDDANPCSRTAPCRTFAGAMTKVASEGEINVLDPGGYGTLIINKSVTIDASGTYAGISTPIPNGINVVAKPND